MVNDFVKLKMLRADPIDIKEMKLVQRIQECIYFAGGIEKVYIAFSGGMDSTVLCYLAEKHFPGIKMMFINTGAEFPEIIKFVYKMKLQGWNIDVRFPKMKPKEVIDKYGFPLYSKEVSMSISRFRNTKSLVQRYYRLFGRIVKPGKKVKKGRKGVIPKYARTLAIENEFKISEKCCDMLKKNVFKKYEKDTGRMPIVGTTVGESQNRLESWLKNGCNAFDLKKPQSRPMSAWDRKDTKEVIDMYNIEISEAYTVHGYERTGCAFCPFGMHLEKGKNRYVRMSETHPKMHSYALDYIGFRKVFDRINLEYEWDDIKKFWWDNVVSKEQKNLF